VPRVTDAHRQARREQIADAAVRVLRRNGISDTSIAQISAECQLSIGAIYANFENKADLARYIATRLFDWRILELDALTDNGTVVTPVDLLGVLLASLSDANRPAPTVILQFWSKASVDDDLREVLTEQVGRLCASAQRALLPWADAQTDGAGEELALRTAQACLTMSQGFLANRCLFGWLDAEQFLDIATHALGRFDAPDLR
jgi:AcrR family transcriptional regulator